MRQTTKTPTQQVVHLSAIISGHIVSGTVSFSPAPTTGILSELAKFEAQRIFTNIVMEEIEAGQL